MTEPTAGSGVPKDADSESESAKGSGSAIFTIHPFIPSSDISLAVVAQYEHKT